MQTNLELPAQLKDIILSRSLPDFIKEQNPMFYTFLLAFYEWLETEETSPNSLVANLKSYVDVDRTIEQFFEHFRTTYLPLIPDSFLEEKETTVKQIKNFYLNRGNEQSFKFLFRLLFNDDISFYYPKVDILRASDGKWYEQKSLKITLTDTDTFGLLVNRRILGVTSFSTAVVESAVRYISRGVEIVELSLSDLNGDFVSGEKLRIFYFDELTQSEVFIEEDILDISVSITMTNGGSGYQIGTSVPVRDSSNAEIAKATVLSVGLGSITGLTVDTAGTGYNGQFRNVTVFGGLNSGWVFDGTLLEDTFVYSQDSNATDFSLYTLETIVPGQLIPGTGDIIEITDSSTSVGSGAVGFVNIVGNNGEIQSVSLASGGSGYSIATAEVISSTGINGSVDVIGGGGSIKSVKLESFPVVIDALDYDSNGAYLTTIDFTAAGNGDAVGIVETDVLARYQGRYLNEDGHLSSSKKLQDNRFYQDYSYVLNVSLDISKWEAVVKENLHPAGLRLFGSVSSTYQADSVISIESSFSDIELLSLLDSPTTIEFYEVLVPIESDFSGLDFDLNDFNSSTSPLPSSDFDPTDFDIADFAI